MTRLYEEIQVYSSSYFYAIGFYLRLWVENLEQRLSLGNHLAFR